MENVKKLDYLPDNTKKLIPNPDLFPIFDQRDICKVFGKNCSEINQLF